MLKLTINNSSCHTEVGGTKLNCSAEAIVGFISLVEVLADATNTSFEHAALFVYQQGVMTKKKTEEESKKEKH